MRMLLRRLIVIVLLLVSGRSVAFADDSTSRAKQSFMEGQAAFEAGDYRRAAAAFEAAYAAKPHHSALWNAARSWQRAGEDLLAASSLERYLREAPKDAPDRDEATSALSTVAKKLGRVQINLVNVTGLMLDGKPPVQGHGQTTIYVAPGEHVAEGRASDKAVRKMFTIKAGELLSVTLTAEDGSSSGASGAGGAGGASSDAGDKPLPPLAVYVGGGLTFVGGVLTVLSGIDTVNKRDAFLDDQTQTKLDDGYSAQTRTNVALGLTIGVAVLTTVAAFFFVDWGNGNGGKKMGSQRWRSIASW